MYSFRDINTMIDSVMNEKSPLIYVLIVKSKFVDIRYAFHFFKNEDFSIE
jgi:hypothetical protein